MCPPLQVLVGFALLYPPYGLTLLSLLFVESGEACYFARPDPKYDSTGSESLILGAYSLQYQTVLLLNIYSQDQLYRGIRTLSTL